MSRKPNQEARDQILESAYCLILKNGFKGVSMDDIADAAGLKKANLFHYYPSKEILALAVFDFAVRPVQAEMRIRYSSDTVAPLEMIDKMFLGAAQGMQKSGCSGGCFAGNLAQELSDCNETLRHKVAGHMHLWSQGLTDYLERWRSKGYFNPDFSSAEAAHGVLSLFEGAMLMAKVTRNTDALDNSKKLALRYLQACRTIDGG